ncbi:hypothetical protein B0H11DRAFT_2282558 [Mycena galericulata]|nr:hypothetical protein B0H11DRAFT_2282558 [Mycena galericulata]
MTATLLFPALMSETSSSTQPPAHDRGLGRPAEFSKRLVRAAAMKRPKRKPPSARPNLPDTAGEPEVEPEVDLSSFLEQQRILDEPPVLTPNDPVDEDDVEHTLAHISSDLDELEREKATAEAIWDLKTCFRASPLSPLHAIANLVSLFTLLLFVVAVGSYVLGSPDDVRRGPSAPNAVQFAGSAEGA